MIPCDAEFTTLEELFIKAMKPLVDITETIGPERWVNISVVHPLLHKLLEVYFKPEESDNITRLEKTMKTSMHTNLTLVYRFHFDVLQHSLIQGLKYCLSFQMKTRLKVIASVEVEVVTVFIRIEARASIFYKWFLTRRLNESSIYLNPGINFLLFTYPG